MDRKKKSYEKKLWNVGWIEKYMKNGWMVEWIEKK